VFPRHPPDVTSGSRLIWRCLLLTLCVALPGATVSSPRHAVLAVDRGHLARFDETGKVIRLHRGIPDAHCVQQLPNGNILVQDSWTRVIELNPSGEIVWSYDCATMNGNAGRKIETHSFTRLDNGRTMIAECGSARIIEVDQSGKIHHEVKLAVNPPDFHRDTRRVHQLPNGHYLVAHEGEGRVTEYAPDNTVVWDYAVPLFGRERLSAPNHGAQGWGNMVSNAIRLKNGNTLIATGNGHSVIEVTPGKEIVWHLKQHDLPGIELNWLKHLEELPNGNFIIGNCYATGSNPQLLEVTRVKKVVWTFADHEVLGHGVSAVITLGEANR
jgi:hypothetical protein